MGTTYVIGVQMVAEAFSHMSDGHAPVYRKVSFHARMVFDFSVGAGGIASLAVYENMGRRTPFYFIGVLATCVAFGYTAFFAYRLRTGKEVKALQVDTLPCDAVLQDRPVDTPLRHLKVLRGAADVDLGALPM
jgi:hypothetical protein